MNKPIAIIAGEPNSISSEIIFKSWNLRKNFNHKHFIIIGSIQMLNLQKKKLKFDIKIKKINKDFNSKDLKADLILSKTKEINQRLYLFLKEHRFESVWPSIQSSKSYVQFENQFHKWFDFLKTIKLLKYI